MFCVFELWNGQKPVPGWFDHLLQPRVRTEIRTRPLKMTLSPTLHSQSQDFRKEVSGRERTFDGVADYL